MEFVQGDVAVGRERDDVRWKLDAYMSRASIFLFLTT